MLEEIVNDRFKVDVYNKYSPYLVAVDCIIFGFMDGELKLLIINRKFEPAKGKWSLMGGFVGPDESMDEAAYRVLYELTGLKDLKMVQLYTHGEVDRDPGARVISTSYYTLIKMQDIDPAHSAENGARWCPINELPELIFDHMKMVEMALNSLRDEAHRFALSYHRKVRDTRFGRSTLEEIPGVGPRRKRLLLRNFGSLEAVRRASVEEIAAIPTMTQRLAEAILEHLKED